MYQAAVAQGHRSSVRVNAGHAAVNLGNEHVEAVQLLAQEEGLFAKVGVSPADI